ncbi:hypothetical protein [Marinobacterium iners]|uniref:hypothetical protein n=1 Tax=Marinobacterium iners TaxID=48076 RepID=UPI001A9085F1|nr:hypothetical protein [Marinobacterium iners]
MKCRVFDTSLRLAKNELHHVEGQCLKLPPDPVWGEVSSLRHALGTGAGMNGTMLEIRA